MQSWTRQWNLLMSVLASKQTLIFLTFTRYCSNATVLENYIALSSPKSIDQLKNRHKTGLKRNSNRLIWYDAPAGDTVWWTRKKWKIKAFRNFKNISKFVIITVRGQRSFCSETKKLSVQMFAWLTFCDPTRQPLFPVATDLFALQHGGKDHVTSWCKSPITWHAYI